jgi:hypothetical protein
VCLLSALMGVLRGVMTAAATLLVLFCGGPGAHCALGAAPQADSDLTYSWATAPDRVVPRGLLHCSGALRQKFDLAGRIDLVDID